MRNRIKRFFTVARFKRFASAYIISYLGTFLSLSFLAIVFWTSVSTPSAVSGIIRHSGVQDNLIFELAKRGNAKEIKNGLIDEQTLKNNIDTVFDTNIKASINNDFSRDFHEWISKGAGPFEFQYDLSAQTDKLRQLNDKINTRFLSGGYLIIKYDSGEASLKLRPQRTYRYFWWATLLGPVLFVLLGVALWFFYKSKLDLLFKIKRMLYYSCIATVVSVPFNNVYWQFLAGRMSTYPKAGLAGALSVKPITSEVLRRMNLVEVLSFCVYVCLFFVIKKYLKSRGFVKVEEKHKNDLWEYTVKVTKFYLRKLK